MSGNRKKQSAATRIHSWVQQCIWGSIYGVAGLFLLINALASQYMPDLFFKLISREKGSFIETMTRARTSEGIRSIESEVSNLSEKYNDQITARDTTRISEINFLEQLLIENPDSRDILYALSVLYREEGNSSRAEFFLEKAQSIDPLISQ